MLGKRVGIMSVVLITGGLGFLGSHVARELLRRGHDVVLLDIAVNEKLIKDVKEKVKIVKGDIAVPTQLGEAVKTYGVNTIIHYAALLSKAAEANPQLAYKVNFEGLWNVFEIARSMDLDAVIFASSIAAYGLGVPQIVKEDTYTIPYTLYGISKQLGEMLGLWFYRKYGIEFAAFRYGAVIGPGRRNGGASAYSTLVVQKPAQGDPYVVNVPKDSRMPIVYVKDVADATLTACEKIRNLKSRIYNLVSLIPSPTAKDIADTVKKYVPNAKIRFEPEPKTSEIVRSWPRDLDITRAQSELGWKPRYSSLDALVADFINEVRQHLDMYTI
jgi:nucleoside-diphosphate-sugar epimerase